MKETRFELIRTHIRSIRTLTDTSIKDITEYKAMYRDRLTDFRKALVELERLLDQLKET
jgi:hypothetical protein